MGPPVEPADQEALTALAKVEERSQEQTVDVSFDVGAETDGDVNRSGDDGAEASANGHRSGGGEVHHAQPGDKPIRWPGSRKR
jgi:hypothetical protein